MKYTVFILLLCCLASCQSHKHALDSGKLHKALLADMGPDAYKVLKIDSVKSACVLHVTRKDSIFKIVSLKVSSDHCNRIAIGQYYKFDLISWINADKPSLIHVDGLHIAGSSIGFKNEDIVQDLFYSKYLKGLCISYE